MYITALVLEHMLFSKMLKSMTADVAVQTSIYTSLNSIYPMSRNKWIKIVCVRESRYKKEYILFVIEC